MADDARPSPFARAPIPRPPDAPSPFARPPRPPVSAPARPARARALAAPAAATSAGDGNLALGLVAGLAAAAGGAGLWALVTIATHRLSGLVALAVGLLVGWAVRRAGRGSTAAFSALGAAVALAGCLAGNLLALSVFVTQKTPMTLLQLAARPGLLARLLKASFNPLELLFYAIAMYEGWRFSIVRRSAR
jgi:hypothetical protein